MNRIPNSNSQALDNNLVEPEENDQMEIIEAYNPETKVMLERFIYRLILVNVVT